MRVILSYLAIQVNVLVVSLYLLGYWSVEVTGSLQLNILILFSYIWWHDGKGFIHMSLKRRLGWLLICLLIMISVSLLVSYLCDVPSNNQLMLTRVQKLLPLTIFVGFLVNASLLEEYFYRQTLWEKLSKPVIQIGVTSMLFALAHHPTTIVTWLVYGGLGLTLGALRLKTDNLTTMLLHVFWNGLVLLLSIL